jgi:hypothetical protein
MKKGMTGQGGSAPSPNFMSGPGIQKGGLHKSLGVPMGQNIPPAAINAAASKPGKVGKQARLAKTYAKFRPKAKAKPAQKSAAKPSFPGAAAPFGKK